MTNELRKNPISRNAQPFGATTNPASKHSNADYEGVVARYMKIPHEGLLGSNMGSALICDSHENASRNSVENGLSRILAQLRVLSFRPHQQRAIEAVVGGRDVLLVAPTASGKTLAFAAAGLVCGGIVVVTYPLVSLIADQARRFAEWGIHARVWNGTVSDDYKAETIRQIQAHACDQSPLFILTTPESLAGDRLRSSLRGHVTLAVADEAHCAVKDAVFRGAYGRLGQYFDDIRPDLRFGCTATIAPDDRAALVTTLGLRAPVQITAPVARDNLRIQTMQRSIDSVCLVLNRHRGNSGIIFAATVRTADALHDELEALGYRPVLYHGKLSAKAKAAAQSAFMSGERMVAVATDALLLGLDKSDLRFVVHFDHPESVEGWVQGFGRAGRDGKPAYVYGMFAGDSAGIESRRFLIKSSHPRVSVIRQVWEYLTTQPWHRASVEYLAITATGSKNAKYAAGSIMTRLKEHCLVDVRPDPDDGRRRIYSARGDFDAVDWSGYQRRRQTALDRFDRLCELVSLDDDQIPAAIDAYFEDGDEAAKAPRSTTIDAFPT